MILKYAKIIIAHILLGVVFGFFYTRLTIPSFDEVNLKIKNVRGTITFELPAMGTHMIKLWGDDTIDNIDINGTRLIHTIYRPRQVLKEFYYIVGPEMTRKGMNELRVVPDRRCSARIKNNIVSTDFGSILFKETDTARPTLGPYTYPVFIAGFILLGLAIVALVERFFAMPFNRFFIKHLLSFLPCLLFLTGLYEVSSAFPIKFIFIEDSFFIFCCFFVGVFYIPLFISVIARELKKIKDGIDEFKLKERFLGLALIQCWLNLKKVDQLTILFLIAMTLCSVLLTFKLEFLAKFIGDIAYLLICAVVVMHLLEIRKNEKGREGH